MTETMSKTNEDKYIIENIYEILGMTNEPKWSATYDDNGNIIRLINNGYEEVMEYDEDNNLVFLSNSTGLAEWYEYDNGVLISYRSSTEINEYIADYDAYIDSLGGDNCLVYPSEDQKPLYRKIA